MHAGKRIVRSAMNLFGAEESSDKIQDHRGFSNNITLRRKDRTNVRTQKTAILTVGLRRASHKYCNVRSDNFIDAEEVHV